MAGVGDQRTGRGAEGAEPGRRRVTRCKRSHGQRHTRSLGQRHTRSLSQRHTRSHSQRQALTPPLYCLPHAAGQLLNNCIFTELLTSHTGFSGPLGSVTSRVGLWPGELGVRSAQKLFTACLHVGAPGDTPNMPLPACRGAVASRAGPGDEVPRGRGRGACVRLAHTRLVRTRPAHHRSPFPLPWKPQLGTGDAGVVVLPVVGAHGPPGRVCEHLQHAALTAHAHWGPGHRVRQRRRPQTPLQPARTPPRPVRPAPGPRHCLGPELTRGRPSPLRGLPK